MCQHVEGSQVQTSLLLRLEAMWERVCVCVWRVYMKTRPSIFLRDRVTFYSAELVPGEVTDTLEKMIGQGLFWAQNCPENTFNMTVPHLVLADSLQEKEEAYNTGGRWRRGHPVHLVLATRGRCARQSQSELQFINSNWNSSLCEFVLW